jgi:hypothetical protein
MQECKSTEAMSIHRMLKRQESKSDSRTSNAKGSSIDRSSIWGSLHLMKEDKPIEVTSRPQMHPREK